MKQHFLFAVWLVAVFFFFVLYALLCGKRKVWRTLTGFFLSSVILYYLLAKVVMPPMSHSALDFFHQYSLPLAA